MEQDQPPWGDASVLAIIDGLRALTTELDRYIDTRGSAHGLHRTDLHALGHVMAAAHADDAMTPTALAVALNLSPPATSALLTRLEAAGHVRRSRSPGDGRRVSITMTDAAMVVGRQLFGPLGQALREVLRDYSRTERETIARFLADASGASAQARGEAHAQV